MRKLLFVIAILFVFQINSQGQNIHKAFETEFTKYTVSAKNCTKIVHFSGSLIFIPEDAFVLNSQNQVDSIDIYYREILTPLDMLVHNIPMTFNLTGKQFYLESNGMFEIWGKQEDDTISVHEDKSIEVRLAIKEHQVDVQMEGFRFDTTNNQWVSYTNQLRNASVDNNDDDLWGSSPVQLNALQEEDEMWEEEDSEWAQTDSIRRVAFQAMEIYEFGLYNYDKIIDDETFISISAGFVDKTSQKPLTSTVYIVYNEINSVFYYPSSTWIDDFSIIQNRSYKLFSIDKEGNIFRLHNFPDLKDIQNNTYTFQLEAENKIPENKQELSKIIRLR